MWGPCIYRPELVELPDSFRYLRVVKPWWAIILHEFGINYGYYVEEN